MRLSSLADYAVVMLAAAARHCGASCRLNATLLANETGLPLPTVQKLVSKLSAAGLIALTVCVDSARHDCAVEGACRVKPHWGVVSDAVRSALAQVSLASLSNPPVLAAAPAPVHGREPSRTDLSSSPSPALVGESQVSF